jgi:hypothetical protein
MFMIIDEYLNDDRDDRIIDVQDAPVCEDFDEDCADVVDPVGCMSGGNMIDPICGICLELQRRQVK